MKIAIFIPTLDSGGAEKQAALLASLLSERFDVHLITFNCKERDSSQNLSLMARTNVVRHMLSGNIMRKYYELKSILKTNGIDVIFNYLTYPNVLGALAAKSAGTKRVYSGIRNSQLPISKFYLERFVHNHLVTATIFNCFSGRAFFTGKGFDENKSIVISNCYSNIAPVIERKDNSIKTIVTVGRFVEQKDYLTAIKSISLLRRNRQDFVFSIIGYGKLESEIRNWVNVYNISDCVQFYIRPLNVHEILSGADIYLSTSLFEGTSNSIMEALNYSLPVVCTNVGDNSYLVQEGVNGYLHSVGDCEGIVSSLNRLLDDSNLRNYLGTNGNRNLRENFSTDVFLSKYLDLLN